MILISSTADIWFFAVSAFLFGVVFGSFLNVCIYRLPLGLSVVSPRSACPSCRMPIAAFDNVPVLSWIILGGRCRNCKTPISPRYWIVELLTGVLFTACVLRFGVNLEAVKFCAFSFLLLGLILTDSDTQLLPDGLTIPGIVIGLAMSPLVYVGGLMGLIYAMTDRALLNWRLESIINSVAGAVLAAGFIYLAGEVWYWLRGVDAMGFGDVKLMGMVGAFLGPKLSLMTIFLGSFTGTLAGIFLISTAHHKRMQRWQAVERSLAEKKAERAVRAIMQRFPIPFGVFLGSGALLSAFFGDALISWYSGLFR